MGKSASQKKQESINIKLAEAQAEQARQAAATQASLQQQRQQIYGQISPFATSALGIGQQAMEGKVNPALVNAYLQPARSALTSSYDQARQNLFESLGSQGVFGSGIGAGAMGAFERSQARDIGNLTQQANAQALQTSLGLGFQGAGLLSGQQALFNPIDYGTLSNQYAQTSIQDPRQYARAGGGILGAALGAGISAIPGVGGFAGMARG